MKTLVTKIIAVCVIAVICGLTVGALFSLFYYDLISDWDWRYQTYLSDTDAKVRTRFWRAFGVGAVLGAAWSWRVVKRMKL